MVSQTFQLVMRSGPNPGKSYELKHGEITIGRDIGNLIVINDPELSRKHARLVAQAGGYVIEDLGSTNGTFVNGQRLIGPHVLRPGELVMLGENVGLVFEVIQFDPDATLVGGAVGSAKPTAPAAPATPETYRVPYDQLEPEPPAPAYQAPVYSGQVPPGPAEPYAPPVGAYEPLEDEGKSSKRLLYIGAGCLVVLLCVCVVGVFVIDSMELWCAGPLENIWDLLGYVCQ